MTTKTKQQRKAGRITVTSAKELQQKALDALQKSGKSGKQSIGAALRAITDTHQPLYALEDVAKSYGVRSALSTLTVAESAECLRDAINGRFALARSIIGQQDATKFLRNAAKALDRMAYLARMADHATESDDAVTPALCDAFSAALVGLVRDAGRWMERAEQALGETPNCGWLSMSYVEGMPEDDDNFAFARLDIQQRWVAREFGKLDQEQRANVATVIGNLVKSAGK